MKTRRINIDCIGPLFFRLCTWLFAAVLFASCKKYLDQPSSKSLVIPKTIQDLQALAELYVNSGSNQSSYPDLGEILSDDYYLTTAQWQQNLSGGSSNDALHYVWNGASIPKDNYWRGPYVSVYYSNVILDILPTIPINDNNKNAWNELKGESLFTRGMQLWNIAQLYCKPYSSTASTDPGVPLRLDPEFHEKSVRSTVSETYTQIINDLKTAVQYLPETNPYTPFHATRAAAYGALARVYLSMRDYQNAKTSADECLQRANYLLDYTTLNASSATPIPLFNNEILYYSEAGSFGYYGLADTNLIQSFDTADIRKKIFFTYDAIAGGYKFKGSYTRLPYADFPGIATDEIYLIRAECDAHLGDATSAMSDLNILAKKRHSLNWTPYSSTDPNDALNKVLDERRKELFSRTLRWSDLRRFNVEHNNTSLQRFVGGQYYHLQPNDLRWVVLIPQDVINYSGMQQNPR